MWRYSITKKRALKALLIGSPAGLIFADISAEVIKVENPDGGNPLPSWRLVENGTIFIVVF